ncbi:hypothetical protein [Cupriavidus pauculus]|uniref:hypothetical protein n=1 Tax=Cupriavidus pauculus TaxID=82633 RepID=UPI0012474531|nr:hypothetical protein [Cupriavidus pauculus]KAB0600750.1 hypothetical protein F7R19_19920 [Cupriavidus pauculus]MCM3604158.1 hypothetical protein [Cupriavidus pauculus]UAL01456.1 hypothetical protein K8O84_09150 [Cupriavidus pauculus]
MPVKVYQLLAVVGSGHCGRRGKVTTRLRRRAIRFIDGVAILLALVAIARSVYVLVTPLTLETRTVGPVLAVAAIVYVTAVVLSILGLGAVLMLCTVFQRRAIRMRALGPYMSGMLLFAALSVATEVWIDHHHAAVAAPATEP